MNTESDNNHGIKPALTQQGDVAIIDWVDALEKAMRELSALSERAKREGRDMAMYAANRAWRELDRYYRSEGESASTEKIRDRDDNALSSTQKAK